MGSMTFQFHVVVFSWSMRGSISKCIGKTKENKGVQTFKTLQKTETAIFIYLYSSLKVPQIGRNFLLLKKSELGDIHPLHH